MRRNQTLINKASWETLLRTLPRQLALYDAPGMHTAGVDLEIKKLTVRTVQNVFLLSFENLCVFRKHCGLTVPNTKRQSSIVRLKVTDHAPVIPG